MSGLIRQAINVALVGLIVLVWIGDRQTLMALLEHVAPQPAPPIEPSPSGTLTLKSDGRGHYLVAARVNGRPVRFMIDTGASNIVLSRKDAEELGLPTGRLIFTQVYSTPGGLVRAAQVTLKEIQIGALRMRDVPASVSERPMDVSLLGASCLNRLAGYEVSGGRMTLRW